MEMNIKLEVEDIKEEVDAVQMEVMTNAVKMEVNDDIKMEVKDDLKMEVKDVDYVKDVNFEVKDFNLEGKDINLERKDVNSERRCVNLEVKKKEDAKYAKLLELVSRRQGIGITLPVGWKPLLPPSAATRAKIVEQILTRRHQEEQSRAKRAEERKNKAERIIWHKEQMDLCTKKIEILSKRKIELDEAKSKLFAELKQVVAKSKEQSQREDYRFSCNRLATNRARARRNNCNVPARFYNAHRLSGRVHDHSSAADSVLNEAD